MPQTPPTLSAAQSPDPQIAERAGPSDSQASSARPDPLAPKATQAAPRPNVTPARFQIPAWILILAAALAAIAICIYVPSLFVVGTDDAYFQANTVSVIPKVAAYVTALHVTDNSVFTAGELLVELDPRDFQVAVDVAAADLQNARAAQVTAVAQLGEQSQIIAADAAKVQGDNASLTFAEQELRRFGTLARNGAGTTENWQQAESNIGVQQATLQSDTATLAAAHAQIDVLRSQVAQADADVAHASAMLAQARLNLSYTKIYAPMSGSVANRTVQVGNFVQPGQALFSAVPNEIYIIANFKETQLTHMNAGQPVSIRVDAFPQLKLRGHVDSFQRGTGAYFALLPPENATGNFVKIVQRVPVKILLDNTGSSLPRLAPGMSVEVTVTVRTLPSWLAPFI